VNAGGVINVELEAVEGRYDAELVKNKVDEIYQTTLKIINLSKEKKISTAKAADEYAEGVVEAARANKK